MTYRGVYRDGVVVLQGDVDLQNGERVEVSPSRALGTRLKTAAKTGSIPKGGRRTGGRAKPRAFSKTQSAAHPLPGFGAWKHRTDIVDSAEFARALRRRTSTRQSAD